MGDTHHGNATVTTRFLQRKITKSQKSFAFLALIFLFLGNRNPSIQTLKVELYLIVSPSRRLVSV